MTPLASWLHDNTGKILWCVIGVVMLGANLVAATIAMFGGTPPPWSVPLIVAGLAPGLIIGVALATRNVEGIVLTDDFDDLPPPTGRA